MMSGSEVKVGGGGCIKRDAEDKFWGESDGRL
jgi:hypothetical protein